MVVAFVDRRSSDARTRVVEFDDTPEDEFSNAARLAITDGSLGCQTFTEVGRSALAQRERAVAIAPPGHADDAAMVGVHGETPIPVPRRPGAVIPANPDQVPGRGVLYGRLIVLRVARPADSRAESRAPSHPAAKTKATAMRLPLSPV